MAQHTYAIWRSDSNCWNQLSYSTMQFLWTEFRWLRLVARNCWTILPSPLNYFYIMRSVITTSFFCMRFPCYSHRLYYFVCLFEISSHVSQAGLQRTTVDDGLELLLLLPRPPKYSDYKPGQFFKSPFLWGLNCQINWIQMWQCVYKPQTLIHGYGVLLMPLI